MARAAAELKLRNASALQDQAKALYAEMLRQHQKEPARFLDLVIVDLILAKHEVSKNSSHELALRIEAADALAIAKEPGYARHVEDLKSYLGNESELIR